MSLSIGKKKIGNQVYYVARECKRIIDLVRQV